MRFLFLFLISYFLVACHLPSAPTVSQILVQDTGQPSTATPVNPDGQRVDQYGNPYTVDERDAGHFRERCSSFIDERSDFKIDQLDYIDAHNFSDYLIKGRCESGEKIEIIINNHPIDTNIYCKSRRWELTVDLTPLAQERVISFKISSSGETFCEDIKVAFTAPKNYITVPALEDFYESGFLVMKYEAKLDKAGINSKAISEEKDRPISAISHSDAQDLCKNNGSRYDLISNKQWQNIARDIESIDENWSLGRARVIEGNSLNCGVARGTAQAASRNDADDCGASSCGKNWDYHRRTHLLSSGDRIWDMCGNVGEVMRDRYTGNDTFDNYVFHLNGSLKKLFGPDKDYNIVTSHRREGYFGLGFIKVSRSADLIIRGHHSRYPGIFSTEITKKRDSSRSASGYNIGFRCVYLP